MVMGNSHRIMRPLGGHDIYSEWGEAFGETRAEEDITWLTLYKREVPASVWNVGY